MPTWKRRDFIPIVGSTVHGYLPDVHENASGHDGALTTRRRHALREALTRYAKYARSTPSNSDMGSAVRPEPPMILNHVRLALATDLAEANRYFEDFTYSTATRKWGDHVDTLDWDFEGTTILKTLLDFGNTGRLSKRAATNLLSLIIGWRPPRPTANKNNGQVARWPVIHTENHDLMNLTIGYFREVLAGRDPSEHARQLKRWLAWRLERGFVEWHSPRYAIHTLNPLLTLARHSRDRSLRMAAGAVINLMFAERALLGVRGYMPGPFSRGYIEHFKDSRTSRFQEVSWAAFGVGMPVEWRGDCLFGSDTFECHPVVTGLAEDMAERPPKELYYRGTRATVNNLRQPSNLGGERLPICFYNTPHVSMASINMKGWWHTGRGFDIQFAADPAHSLRTFRGSLVPYPQAQTSFVHGWVEAAQHRNWALSRGELQVEGGIRPERAGDWQIYRSGKGLCAVTRLSEDWHVFQVSDLDRFSDERQFVNSLLPQRMTERSVVGRAIDGAEIVVNLYDMNYTVDGKWADWSEWLHHHECLRSRLDCGRVEIRSSRGRLVLDAGAFQRGNTL